MSETQKSRPIKFENWGVKSGLASQRQEGRGSGVSRGRCLRRSRGALMASLLGREHRGGAQRPRGDSGAGGRRAGPHWVVP